MWPQLGSATHAPRESARDRLHEVPGIHSPPTKVFPLPMLFLSRGPDHVANTYPDVGVRGQGCRGKGWPPTVDAENTRFIFGGDSSETLTSPLIPN